MNKIIGIILLTILLAVPVSYAQDRFEFKGIAIKSDISVIEKDPRITCRDPKAPIADL